MAWDDAAARRALRAIFDAAVSSADPFEAVTRNLPERPVGRCVVVGAGKASAAMAAALDVAWSDVALSGIVVTRYGHAVAAGRIEVIEASHPVPDAGSVVAANRILNAVRDLGPDDLVIALISGGGSSLMVSPAEGLTLADKQALNKSLLESGAPISEMNVVRKALSRVKGGRLAEAAYPARVVTLLISDVPGDDPSEIASGPTVESGTGRREAREIVSRYDLQLPENVRAALERPDDHQLRSHPKSEVRLIASPSQSLAAASETAKSLGLLPVVLGDAIEGEAREAGRVFAGIAKSVVHNGLPVSAPAVLLSGGETTVTLPSNSAGRGGRNTEFLLSMAVALSGERDVWAISGDTDGIDGVEDAAGAIIAPDTLERLKSAGVDPKASLKAHDSYSAFKAIEDLVVTGPTLTNVNDIRVILIGK